MSTNGFTAGVAIACRCIPDIPNKAAPFLGVSLQFWRDSKTLGPYAVHVYLCYLSHRNNKTGLAWPKLDTVAKETGISKSEVRRSIAALSGKWLVLHSRSRNGKVYYVRGVV